MSLQDSFHSLSQWRAEGGGGLARLVPSDLRLAPYDLKLGVPPCGQSLCDHPDLVLSYARHWQLRSPKEVRYRVINLAHDDGSQPTVTAGQVARQHADLAAAFRPYNISFRLTLHPVRNSTLRRRLVMFGCRPELVGDGHCHPECMHAQTGLDGGDCDSPRLACGPGLKGDGRCHFPCNRRYHDWDGGDCCLPGHDTHYTCHDPRSPHR